MRLPYLQVDSDAWGRAKVLAALLGCDRHRAMSLQVDLWLWALERGEGMPDGVVVGANPALHIAGAVEWTGDATELSVALVESGLLAVLDDKAGFRVRGLDRYASAFERQEADRQRKAEARLAKKSASKASVGSPQEVRRKSAGSPQEVRRKSKEVRSIDVDVDVDVKNKETTPQLRASARNGLATPLQEQLDAVFLELRGSSYAWSMDEHQAARRLLQLANGDNAEIVSRWRNALARTRFPLCTGMKDLVRHWNAYAAPESAVSAFVKPDKPGGRDGLTKQLPARGDPCAWVGGDIAGCTGIGVESSGGQWLCAACAQASSSHWRNESLRQGEKGA